MKRLFLLFILSSLVVLPALAQNPALYQGANLTFTGNGTLTVQGDLQNASGSTFDNQGKVVITGNLLQESDATLFTNPGTVALAGTAGQTIGGTGTGPINLDSLIINNPDTVTLARDGVSVTAGLRFVQGIFFLNANRNLALGSTGQLVNEQESSRAAGPGSLTASADLNAPAASDPGNLGLLISSGANLGSTTVTRTHTPTGPQDNGIFRSFAVSPTNNQNLNANLRLNYFDAELNGLTESSLAPFTSDDGNSWQQQSATNQSSADNFVAYGGLASLNFTTLSEGQALPVADAGSDATVCAGESVQLGGNPAATDGTQPYTYAWSPTEGLDDASLANPTATPTATTTYTLVVTDANGNTDESQVTITVNALPTVTFAAVDPQCINNAVVDLSGLVSPAGGSFSGTGITDSSFDPATAGVGTHTITYSYTDGNSCENTATVDIVVNDLPEVTFTAVAPVCAGTDALDLSGLVSPAGGSFSGSGISGSNFDPTLAGVGTHTIIYTYTDANSCENSASVDITVNDLPEVTFTSVNPVCIDAEAVDLSGLVSPSGGSFSGSGVDGDLFDPTTAGVGTHTITYSYTDGNSCENTATVDIVVNALPVVTFNPAGPFCPNDAAVDLSSFVSPAGGSFFGAGISGSSFDPASVGIGEYDILYTFTDGNGCSNGDTVTIVVGDDQAPVADTDPLPELTLAIDEEITTFPTATDNCSGPITATTTDPLSYDQPGSYTITWTYTDAANNQATQTQTVIVEGTGEEVEPLNLTSDCSENPKVEREWRVTNPNDFDVPYTYVVVGTNQTEDLIATPGLSYFTTDAVKGPNTTKILWLDENGVEQQRVKASGGATCTPDEVEPLKLTADCSGNPQVESEWEVYNPNDFDVPYTYVVVGTNQTEDLIATPGLSYFTTDAVKGANTTKITWLDEDGEEQKKVKASSEEACDPTLTFKTSEGSCEFALDELPHDLDEVVASAPATYANFNRKRGTYVVGVIAGMRTDGRAGAWEIHNDCTIKPLRQGARKNNSELPNRSHSGLKYKHNWRFEVTGISSDGGTIFADAINDEGYQIKRGQCKAAGAPDVQPGTIVPISWALSDRPFYGRIKGARLGYECEVERFNCSNGYIVGCASSVARS